MIWFVRILVIGAFLLYAFVTGRSPILGLFSGLFAIGLSLLVGKLGKAISGKVPVAARYAGIAFYWIGIALAVWFGGMAVYAAYWNASKDLLGFLAVLAVIYWAVGWGLRRSLRPN